MSRFDRPEYPDTERRPLLNLVPETAKVVLDVGCNRGAFGRALKKERGVEVWGLEPDPVAAAVAEQHLDHVVVDLFRPGCALPDAHFDLITFNDSLEHMVDPGEALEICKAKLKPGGRIHCCVPNMRHISNLEHLIRERDWRYEDQGIRDRTHLRFFTKKSIARLFQESGFRVLDVRGINEEWWDKKAPWRRIFFRLFPDLTSDMRHIQYVVIAQYD